MFLNVLNLKVFFVSVKLTIQLICFHFLEIDSTLETIDFLFFIEPSSLFLNLIEPWPEPAIIWIISNSQLKLQLNSIKKCKYVYNSEARFWINKSWV